MIKGKVLALPHNLSQNLVQLIDRETSALSRISEQEAGVKPSPNAWSKKEELGHLIDSAANNHIRFVAASLQPAFQGAGYEQNGWVDRHGYNGMPWAEIVDFWRRYNQFLAALVRRIPEDRLETPCVIGDGPSVTLRFLIEDYQLHKLHHIDHILQREKITEYPSQSVGA